MREIEIRRGFAPDQAGQAAEIYWAAFAQKLGRWLGPKEKALELLRATMNPDFALTAVNADGAVMGLAGFKTREGQLIRAGFADLKRVYGGLPSLWRAAALSGLARPLAEGTLLMDGIAVAAEARGQGLGRRLLDAILSEARARGCARVRLDVIDENPRARALYERMGFESQAHSRLGLLRHVYGFSGVREMYCTVGPEVTGQAAPGEALRQKT